MRVAKGFFISAGQSWVGCYLRRRKDASRTAAPQSAREEGNVPFLPLVLAFVGLHSWGWINRVQPRRVRLGGLKSASDGNREMSGIQLRQHPVFAEIFSRCGREGAGSWDWRKVETAAHSPTCPRTQYPPLRLSPLSAFLSCLLTSLRAHIFPASFLASLPSPFIYGNPCHVSLCPSSPNKPERSGKRGGGKKMRTPLKGLRCREKVTRLEPLRSLFSLPRPRRALPSGWRSDSRIPSTQHHPPLPLLFLVFLVFISRHVPRRKHRQV